MKFLKIAFAVLFLIFAFAILFLNLWKPFGKKPSSGDKKNYEKRAKNFDGKIFKNEIDFKIMQIGNSHFDEKKISSKGEIPKQKIPLATPNFSSPLAMEDVTVTWLGHSSVLIQMRKMNILLDPVFSNLVSPVSFFGVKRFSDLPIKIEQLPQIDILIFSHDHYDHLDFKTVLLLDKKVNQYIVPLGIENHLARWGIEKNKIQNMAWWQEVDINGLKIACTPSQHFSGRSLNDHCATLWASWVFVDQHHKIFASGDSGFGEHYKAIYEKYGTFDFVMPDCAQYNKKWPFVHQTPEQALEAVKILGAKIAMPIHWGAFVLSNHAWDDPATRMVAAAKKSDVAIATPKIGETMNLRDAKKFQTRWYEEIF